MIRDLVQVRGVVDKDLSLSEMANATTVAVLEPNYRCLQCRLIKFRQKADLDKVEKISCSQHRMLSLQKEDGHTAILHMKHGRIEPLGKWERLAWGVF